MGQTEPMRMPFCSSMDSSEVSLASSPAAAALHSVQEGAVRAEATDREAASRNSWDRWRHSMAK